MRPSATLFFLLIAVACYEPTPEELQIDYETRPGDAERGKELYREYGCYGCHGMDGGGDGPRGLRLEPPPRDLTDPMNYRYGSTTELITATLERGIDGTAMQGYSHIHIKDRVLIAKYVVSLQKKTDRY